MTNLPQARRVVPAVSLRMRLSPQTCARLLWAAGALALIVLALATPGLLSRPSLVAIANSAALVGCVAIGMSFITISGNLMSFSLGATVSASAVVFMSTLPAGVVPAVVLTLAFGAALSALQGFLVGWLRANPIIVSMAAFALILGLADHWVGAKVDAPNDDYLALKGQVGGVPVALLVFLGAAAVAQAILSWTRLGHQIRLVGSNRRASEAAAIGVSAVVTGAYALAGLFTALAGILIAIRYDTGDMQMGTGFEYQAIAAVLVGGIAIEGGRGSMVRAVGGVGAIAVMNAIALLWGLTLDGQRLVVALAVLAVVVLQGLERWR